MQKNVRAIKRNLILIPSHYFQLDSALRNKKEKKTKRKTKKKREGINKKAWRLHQALYSVVMAIF